MTTSIDTLFKQVSAAYNEETLKKISTEIISAYKAQNSAVLYKYSARLGLEIRNPGKLFMRLIMHYHPDKQAAIQQELGGYLAAGDRDGLEKYARAIGLAGYVPENKTLKSFARDLFEEYRYGAEDFGYGEYEVEPDPETGEEFREELFEEEGFIEAVKQYMYGNLNLQVLPKDFLYLEGELVLAGRGIADLTGVEYCRNITSLDLSHNEIENIHPLGELANLRHLDLSYNELTDIDPLGQLEALTSLDLSCNRIEEAEVLLQLQELEFINLMGNPLEDRSLIRRLQARGVVVIMD